MIEPVRHDQNGVKKKTAFVFSGGSILGSVQVGMARALFEHGIVPDFCVGTSVGAINAAYLCGNPTLEGVHELGNIWLSVRVKDIFPGGMLKCVYRFFRKKNYLISSKGLRALLERSIPFQTFSEMKIPCLLMTTDILSGEQVVISSGNIIDAVLASTALPGIYPPVDLAGRILIDGGISSNTPLAAAAEFGAVEVFILPASYPGMLQTMPKGLVDIFSHAMNLLIGQQFLRDIEHYRKEIAIHIIPPINSVNDLVPDMKRTAEFMTLSYRNTLQWFESGGMDTFIIPGRMLPPSQWL